MVYDYNDGIAKGREYAEQAAQHIFIQSNCSVLFKGRHSDHHLQYVDESWICDCNTFQRYQGLPCSPFCPHIYAAEKTYPNGPPQ